MQQHTQLYHWERETRLELATYSLEGYRSTKWATPAYRLSKRTWLIYCLDPPWRTTKWATPAFLKELWAEQGSNLRTRERTDLQSVAFNHSAICPYHQYFINHCIPFEPLVRIEPTTFPIYRDALPCRLLLSHLSGSNQRPTDYKSVALPAELKWLVKNFLSATY